MKYSNRAILTFFLGIVLLLTGSFIGPEATNTNTSESQKPTPIPLRKSPDKKKKEKHKVARVIDGDTIRLESGRVVRYIGIDAPETVDPKKGTQCFGKEASLENKKLVEGKMVFLEKDVSETDRFGRLLRYVYIEDGFGQSVFVNEYLAAEGYAYASSYPPDVRYQDVLRRAQADAQKNKKGLWKVYDINTDGKACESLP